MFSKKLAAAAALAAALAATAPAAHARQSPLPPGACVTHGAAGLAYGVGVNCRTVEHDGIARRYIVYVPQPSDPGRRRAGRDDVPREHAAPASSS